MNTSFQQIKQATKRKVNGLFFIKSKHVRPTFKNHSYFQMKPKSVSQCQSTTKDGHRESSITPTQTMKRWSMFVNQPSGYGIDNTFRYMCDQIKQSKRKQNLIRNISEAKRHSVQNKNNDFESLKTNQFKSTSLHYNPNIPKLRQTTRIQTQPTRKYLQTTQSFTYRRTPKKLLQTMKTELQLSQIIDQSNMAATHYIQMVYVFGNGESLYLNQQNSLKINFNILPYVLNCFFKCKINYNKNLTQNQYHRIKKCIQNAQISTKTYFDVKDILNLSTVAQIMHMLDLYGQGTIQYNQTSRYFFIPKEQVLNYQFCKAVDEMKMMSMLKFNIQLTNSQIYIYRIQDRVRITNLYDFLKKGTYIYSQNKLAYEIYENITKHKSQINSYKDRIKKWRSIAPLHEPTLNETQPIIQQSQAKHKFNRLFQITKDRRRKIINRKPKSVSSGPLLTSEVSSFIDRSKLNCLEDIFQ